eukprot:gene7236-8412_t
MEQEANTITSTSSINMLCNGKDDVNVLKPPPMRDNVNGFPKLADITQLELMWLEQVYIWNTDERDVSRLCRLGIPQRIRGFIWRLASGSIELERKNIGVYHYFLTKTSEEYEYKISKDISRTFPKIAFFSREEGQISLFNILKAYSIMDPEIGYTQGMSFIAAILLSEMDEIPVLFASEWISTLFTYNFDLDISKRLWDVFFIDGRYYLNRLVLAILKINEKHLLTAEFEEAVEFLKRVGFKIDPELLLSVADSISIPMKQVTEYEEEFNHPDAPPSDYF